MSLVPSAMLSAALQTLAPAEDGLTLHWEAPSECPDASAVLESFERHAKAGHRGVEAEGSVTREGSLYVLELALAGPGGVETRRIEAASCDALAETAGLLSAVASEPATEPPVVPAVEPGQPEDSEPEPEPATLEPEAKPERAEEPEPAAIEPPLAPSSVQLVVRAEGLVQALRLLPRVVGAGAGGALGVAGPRWRAELRGQYFAPQPRDYADVVVGGAFDLWTVGVVGCWAPAVARVAFPLCGGLEGGSLRGRTREVDIPGHAGFFFAGLTGDASVVFAASPRVGLRAGVGGVLSLRRPKFHVRDQETLFEAGYGAVRGSLGLEIRFL